MKENISKQVKLCFYCIFVHWQVVYLYTFCNILKELEFAIRQTRIHELNKNDMKLELVSCHESTNYDEQNFHVLVTTITSISLVSSHN